jgi:hypothetical protein
MSFLVYSTTGFQKKLVALPPIGGYGHVIPLPRRGGGGGERGGDACIALGGACFAFHPHFVLEPFLGAEMWPDMELT